ncbi:transcriptional regulator [Thermosipho africanus Ob7]|uniref:helix-turn-helix domain-containing protein n=1 Tax=Thermosipho TaxID=2420 RepID=UPI000E0A1CEC|nr:MULTISPECIES: helix-turn-helix domain-containing protein [Thermosipho]MBZ4649825.1 putative transcriptional regulator [Thermosipho sp. (in: thermotogales)]MDK2839607.1 hypothetical protein [Thermosipho sp. (in: thermotogales)]MDK2900051.1 hypothetical protein [Thermosipho sp. (in: thermotogales)]RDI92764.1 transcriptional regulator [Thermosipho africanus Ob7]
MIKILIPQVLVESLREFLYEHREVVFDIYNSNLEEKIREDYWDIVYLTEEKTVPGKILVYSLRELELAVKLFEVKEEHRRLKEEYDMLYSFPELQGPIIREFLQKVILDFKEKNELVLLYEDGMYVNEYRTFFESRLPHTKVKFSKKKGVKIPPLRDRKEDIPYIFDIVLSSLYLKHKNLDKKIPDNNEYELLKEYNWPGNTKELVKVASNYAATGRIEIPRFKASNFEGIDLVNFTSKLVKHVEKRYIMLALKKSNSRFEAAKMLKINYKTLSHKIKLYGIENSKKR